MRPKRRILALDGGGIKGVLEAAFLDAVETATGKRIADHFDLVAGTSTGGIIALGLVSVYPRATSSSSTFGKGRASSIRPNRSAPTALRSGVRPCCASGDAEANSSRGRSTSRTPFVLR